MDGYANSQSSPLCWCLQRCYGRSGQWLRSTIKDNLHLSKHGETLRWRNASQLNCPCYFNTHEALRAASLYQYCSSSGLLQWSLH
jgi:hypothetical protein